MKKDEIFLIGGFVALTALIVTITSSRKSAQQTLNQLISETEGVTDEALDFTPMFVDRRASFAIYTNGTFREFSAAMYHNQSPDAYIESGNPNIVRISKPGLKWKDFFSSLPFQLTKECLTTGTGQTFCNDRNNTLKFYIDGGRDDDLLESEMQDGQRILITYGPRYDTAIAQQLRSLSNSHASQ